MTRLNGLRDLLDVPRVHIGVRPASNSHGTILRLGVESKALKVFKEWGGDILALLILWMSVGCLVIAWYLIN